jgi:hypothetical protein
MAYSHLTRWIWCAPLEFIAGYFHVETGLCFKRSSGLFQDDGLVRFGIYHLLLDAGAILSMKKMKVDLSIHDCGVEFDRDLVLLNVQRSLPDRSRVHVFALFAAGWMDAEFWSLRLAPADIATTTFIGVRDSGSCRCKMTFLHLACRRTR